MGVRPLVVTGAAELQTQLDHPSAANIRDRAIEVFGNEAKAAKWLSRRRRIFGDRSPDEIIQAGDIAMMRDVLKSLIALEFGTFS